MVSSFDTLVSNFDKNVDLETQLCTLRAKYSLLKEEELAAASRSEYTEAAKKKEEAAALAGEEVNVDGGVVFKEFTKLLEARSERERLTAQAKTLFDTYEHGRVWYSKNSEYAKAEEAKSKAENLKAKLTQLVDWTMQPDTKALEDEIKTSAVGAASVSGPDATKGADLKWADWKAKRKVILELPPKEDPTQRRRDLFSSSLHIRLSPALLREEM